jgi:hypothetical protein
MTNLNYKEITGVLARLEGDVNVFLDVNFEDGTSETLESIDGGDYSISTLGIPMDDDDFNVYQQLLDITEKYLHKQGIDIQDTVNEVEFTLTPNLTPSDFQLLITYNHNTHEEHFDDNGNRIVTLRQD